MIARFDGSDLFSSFARRRDLPIGNLTGQFFANVYLDRPDHFVKEVLRAPCYVRYVNDCRRVIRPDMQRRLATPARRVNGGSG